MPGTTTPALRPGPGTSQHAALHVEALAQDLADFAAAADAGDRDAAARALATARVLDAWLGSLRALLAARASCTP